MSYYGGLGAGKGWLTFLFLAEPKILRDVLTAVNPVLIVTGTRVPADYESTPLSTFLARYARYLEAMLEPSDAALRASSVYMGLAASLAQFSPRPCPNPKYKLMTSDEPVVNFAPLMLHYDAARGRLSTNVWSNLYFGVQLTFPRVISLDRDKHETLYDTAPFATFGVFEEVKSRLQQVTRPCKIRSPAREHRTSIRITDAMRSRMKDHPGLKEHALELV